MPFCPTCGAQLADGAACPKCAPGTVAVTTAGAGLTDNVAGALAYVLFIPAIVFLVLEPYNRRPFIRFHSFQSLFFAAVWVVAKIALMIVALVPFLGWATIFLWPVVMLAFFIIWLVLMLKAYQGQMFKLPFIGDIAQQQAGA